jgi:energy-coupling factor transport system ATP-binding protein
VHRTTRTGRLTPAELAEAVVLGDLSLALMVLSQLLPFGGALAVAAVVPLAVVSSRHRLRAVIAAAVSASAVGFLVIGTPALTTMAACSATAAVIGAGDRRGWSKQRTLWTGVALLWPPISAITLALLVVFSNLRDLMLDQIRNGWKGTFHLLHNGQQFINYLVENPALGVVVLALVCTPFVLGIRRARATDDPHMRRAMYHGLGAAAGALTVTIVLIEVLGSSKSRGDTFIDWVVRNWWLTIPIGLLAAIVFGLWIARGLSAPTLRRVQLAFGAPTVDSGAYDDPTRDPGPVPARLDAVSFRYPNAPTDALREVSVEITPGELAVIVGPNGSGKSTLARVIAGRLAPSGGHIDRPGSVGLGRPGGTSFVFQRPEAQVLGVRVRDDVVWGLLDPDAVDVDAALARVGLTDFADRETSTLSGGELQRLAVAAAIARTPQLMVSDESTAMLDTAGRAAVVALLGSLARDGMGVVHVSHYPSEAELADRTIALEGGRIVASVPRTDSVPDARRIARPGIPLIELRNVGYVYSRGTPWAHRALADVNLTIRERESVLVVGHNGSGKSTLAWIMAGLVVPSEGEARIGSEYAAHRIGDVGLAFQHARLQLLRPTVLDDVRIAAKVGANEARNALIAVGLDPEIATRRTDELSGGQMRRLVLAEVLAGGTKVVVLDEPFAGLDSGGRGDLEALLLRLRNQHGMALVIVSHDRDLPPSLIERVIELEAGRIVRDDPVGDVVAGSEQT